VYDPSPERPIGAPQTIIASPDGGAISLPALGEGRFVISVLDAPAPCEITSHPDAGGLPIPVVAAGDPAFIAGSYSACNGAPRLWLRATQATPVRICVVWQGGV